MVPMVVLERPEVVVSLARPATTAAGRVPVNTPPKMEATVQRGKVGEVVETRVTTGMRVVLYTLKTIS
jgi:hypothetical protein